ncbi:MAG: discoidin domain-containing protein, partial [Acidimicrobiia bacterium]
VGDVVLRNDLQVDRYNLVRPTEVWNSFVPLPSGIGAAMQYGTTIPGRLRFPLQDEQTLGRLRSIADPAPVAVLPVLAPTPMFHTASTNRTMVMAGNGDGLVNLAANGLVDGNEVVLNPGSFATKPETLRALAGANAALVLTDTNRRQARRWSTVADNLGVTEATGEQPLVPDPGDARLAVYPDATNDAATVVEQRGVARVTATAYGNPISYTPEDRAARALDGDTATAWRVGAFADVTGETWRVDLQHPVTTGSITVVQPLNGARNRFITRVMVRLDGRTVTTVALDDTSRTSAGQRITFPEQAFTRLELQINDTNVGRQIVYDGQSPVGFAEVRLADDVSRQPVRVDEVIRLPRDLLTMYGADSATHPLSVVLSRARVRPVPPRYDEELTLARVFTLPTARTFGVNVQARLRTDAPDLIIDTVLGYPSVADGGIEARSSEHLAGDLRTRARAAFDGNADTAWVSPFLLPGGNWIEARAARPITFEHLDLQLVADGSHSVPTRIQVEAGGVVRDVALPEILDQAILDRATPTRVAFPALTGDTVRITITAIRKVTTLDTFSRRNIAMPVAIAEVGVPGLVDTTVRSAPDSTVCRSQLFSVNGTDIPLRVVAGTNAEAGAAITLEPCVGPLTAAAGDVEVRTTAGGTSGIDIDEVVLASGADGASANPSALLAPAVGNDLPPEARVVSHGPVGTSAEIRNAAKPFWLVLGQSANAGWRLQVSGATASARTLVDGYANGWRITPDGSGGPILVRVEWTPQRWVWRAIGVSVFTVLLSLGIVTMSWWRARR